MEKIDIAIYTYKYTWDEDDAPIRATMFKDTDCTDRVWIGIHAVTIEENVPSKPEMTAMQITALNNQKKQVLADAQMRAEKLDEQIQSLMAITAE